MTALSQAEPISQTRAQAWLPQPDPRWAKIVERDSAADGSFFYSVATTGVYCRPSCAARLPNPKNVRFHQTAADAEAAGFRPCKRCTPDLPPQAERNAAIVAAACRRIEESEEPRTLAALAKAAGLSTFHFHRVFKAATGLTPKAYATARRAARVRDQIATGGSVTEAIYDAGFNSSGRFYAEAGSILGMTPGAYRAGGTGAEIRFAIGDCSLGSILVAQSGTGVCAILIGDDPEVLLRDLQDRFPRARLIGGDASFEELVAKVVGFVEAPALGLDLPLDVRGTAFQQRVWQALRDIPPGSTLSYSEVAQKVGAPKAVRAVAQACAANALAVVIPCHPSGNRKAPHRCGPGGLERKRALLDREGRRDR